MMPKLLIDRGENLTLAETLGRYRGRLCPGEAEAVALLQATGGFRFARLTSTGFAWPPPLPGAAPDDAFLATVYSARLFRVTDGSVPAELRWQHEAAGRGAAAFVHTGEATEDGKEIRGRLPASRLLWGTFTGAAKDGWACLAEARVGAHWIPFRSPLEKGRRLYLRSVELIGTEPLYGNAYIMDELLHAIDTTPAEGSADAR